MSDEAFYGILLLLSAVSAGYVLSHLAVERLSRRMIVVPDVQYVVLGVVLGPLLGVIDTERAQDLRPVLSLGGAALGMLAGLRLRETRGDWAPSIAITVATACMVIGLPLGLTSYGAPWNVRTFPFAELSAVDFGMPQIYEANDNMPSNYPERSVAEWQKLGYPRVVPASSANKSPDRMRSLLARTPVLGKGNWWRWLATARSMVFAVWFKEHSDGQ